ncbi:MAG: hypothetical protein AAB512_05335 [Patescibacteria group bacterium]
MKQIPKILLGSSVIILTLVLIILTIFLRSNKGSKNSLTLTSQNNEFKILFDLDKKSEGDFYNLLSNINAPSDTKQGITFDLDSTSEAKLAFLTPINASFDSSDKKISYSGKLARRPNLSDANLSQINIPQDTIFALAAPNLSHFLISRLNLDANSQRQVKEKINSEDGQYLIIFGKTPDYALFFKKDLNTQTFKEIPLEASQESEDNQTKIYSLDIPQENSQVGLFSEVGEYKIYVSSREAVKKIIDSQNSNHFFPEENNVGSLALAFYNDSDKNLNDDFFNFLLTKAINSSQDRSTLQKSLQKIKKATFALKDDTFSGLISVK